MNILPFVLQLIALFMLGCAALNKGQIGPFSTGWTGMFLWLCSLMVSGIVLHPTLGAH